MIARTRFTRRGSSTMSRELARDAARRNRSGTRAEFERFFHARLVRFLQSAPTYGLLTDDAGDARAAFVQIAFKLYDGAGFGDGSAAVGASGLWGGGAIAGMARSERSFARLAFAQRLKYLLGASRAFAALDDRGKQRVYDFYAIAAQTLIDGYRAAVRARDSTELGALRKAAHAQLRADLGVEPDRVRFTSAGIEVE